MTDHSFSEVNQSQIASYIEGKHKTVTVSPYDRKPAARQACIDNYGYSCSICGFNFKETYGDLGSGFLEVHHLKKIADIGEEYEIDPIKDLRPVCANCYRILYKTRIPYSVEDLQKIIKH